jgi:hypothetical protein
MMSDTATCNGQGSIDLMLEAPERKGGRHTAQFSYGEGKQYTDTLNPDDAGQREALLETVVRLHLGLGAGEEAEDRVRPLVEELDQKMQHQRREERKRQEQAAAAEEARQQEAAAGPEDINAQARRLFAEMPAEVRRSARDRLHSPDLIEQVAKDAETIGIAGETDLVVTLYLVGTSRLLLRPASSIVKGPTSSGKSYVLEKVATLFPGEAIIQAQTMTPQALYHMKPGALRHRWVVAGERSRKTDEGQADATRALREMLSSGRLSKMMPVKMGNDLLTVLIQQDGPIAFAETTSMEHVFDEDENRCLTLYTDERTEQTKRIVEQHAARCAGEGNVRDADRVIQVHHAMQRRLRRRGVVIPFARRLGDLLPKKRVETRRAFPHLLSIVEASALLHQLQRAKDDEGRVIATRADYELAARLLGGPMSRLLGGAVSEPARRFWERLKGWFPPGPADSPFTAGPAAGCQFTAADAATREDTSRAAVYGWIGELYRCGALVQVEQARGRHAAVWRLAAADLELAAGAVLPAVAEVFPD